MGFKITHTKYRQERQKTNMSESQGWPMRHGWGYQSNLHPPGPEWEFPNFSSTGWDKALGPGTASTGWGRHQELHPPCKCCLQSCKGETQQPVRKTDLPLICYSSQVPVWLHFLLCGTGHTQGETVRSPMDSKCGAAGLSAGFPLESQGESGQMGRCRLCGQWMRTHKILARMIISSCVQ